MIVRVVMVWAVLFGGVLAARAWALTFSDSLMLSYSTIRYVTTGDEIYVQLVDVERQVEKSLLPPQTTMRAVSTWLPDRRRFIYALYNSVHLFDFRTGQQTELLANVQVSGMAAAPSGDCFAYVATGELVIYCVDSGEARPVPLAAGVAPVNVDWSRDDRLIISAMERNAMTYDLYMVDTATLDVTQITNDGLSKYHPRFVAGSQSVVYATFRSDFPRLLLLNLDTGIPRPIRTGRGAVTNPSVSPDGRYLAFVARSSNITRDVYLLEMETGIIRQLSDQFGDVSMPEWVP